VLFFDDYKKMLDETKPDLFGPSSRTTVPGNFKECAPRHIHVIYEKPLASTYKDAVMADLAKKYNEGDATTRWPVARQSDCSGRKWKKASSGRPGGCAAS
jgi:hypothetical protein